MITADEAMVLLRDACPSFRPLDLMEYPDDPGGYGRMAELSALARHVVQEAEVGSADEFPALFEVVERLLTDGPADVKTMIRTHLIEDIQNITSHRDVGVSPDAFRGVLGERTLAAWDELDASWAAAATQPGTSPDDRPDVDEFLHLDHGERHKLQAMTRELPDGTLARPSDVLRFESDAYDASLTAHLARRRRYPWIVLGIALLVIALCIIITS